ncbi:MAG: hypothetical protein ABIN83_05305 [Sphingomicrobium sp.]
MHDRQSAAGGFFLVLFILLGFGIGAKTGQPLIGTLGGTAIGAAVAILIWLRDRKRRT